MRALTFLVPAAVLVATIAAASGCSGSDAAPTTLVGDAGSDAPLPIVEAGSTPDAGGDSALPKEAGPSGPTIARDPAVDQLADATCAFYQRCFPAYISEYTGTLAGCKSGAAVALRGTYAPGALFDKAAFDASTACLTAASCDKLYGSAFQIECAPPAPVNGAAVGAECNKANDCASGLCNGKTSTACGHCAASTIVKTGDACDESTGKICAKGSICAGKCIQEQGLGATCDGDFTTGTMVCGSALKCVSGKCAKAAGNGTACTKSGDCDVFQLQVCDKAASLTCVTIQFVGADAACETIGTTTECGQGLRCIAAAGSSSGTCKPAVMPGNACVRSSDCVFGYNCRSNVCTAAGSDLPVCK